VHEHVESRLRGLARRAGWASAPPKVVAAALVLGVLAIVVAAWRWWPSGASGPTGGQAEASVATEAPATRPAAGAALESGNPPSVSAGDTTVRSASTGSTVCVDVVGAVRHPGVYVMDAGVRVAAALEAAGGTTDKAATDALNLAAKIEDGQQIVVPTKDQVASGSLPAPAGAPGPGGSPQTAAAAKVDLNAADTTQLDALPGIGPSTAAKIVADRQANGRFKSLDDLGRVSGIGPKKLDGLKDLVVVR
jgi:competence protein ComEA